MIRNTAYAGIVMLSGLIMASGNANASRVCGLFETGFARTSVFTTIPSTTSMVLVPSRSMATMTGAAIKRTHASQYQAATLRRMFSTGGSDSNGSSDSNNDKSNPIFVKYGIRIILAGAIAYSLLPCRDECQHRSCTLKRNVYGMYGFIAKSTAKYVADLYSFHRGYVPIEIWDDSCPLKQRSQVFNQYLSMFNKGKKLEDFKERFSYSLPDSPFKKYGELAFEMKAPAESTTYYLYGIQRQLIALHSAHPDIEMPFEYRDLFNAKYDPWESKERSPLYFRLNHNFIKSALKTDGSIYGFVYDEYYRVIRPGFVTLFCCEENTGQAVWSASIKLKSLQHYPRYQGEEPRLAFGKDILYILADWENVVALDKRTGTLRNRFSIKHKDLPIDYIGATEDNHLFMVHKHKDGEWDKSQEANLTVINLRNLEPTISLPLSQQRGELLCSTAGNYFASSEFGTGVVSFFNTKGNRCDIDGDPQMKDELLRHMPKWMIIGDRVIFDQRVAEGQYQLVSYNVATNQPEWTMPLDSRLQESPAIGLQKDMAFVLTEKKLMAIKLSPDTTARKSWESSVETGDIFRETITRLQVSGDGKFVYGLHEHLGSFYRFTVNTGCIENLGEIKAGHQKRLAGTAQDGTIYMYY